jgi:hypothetical protein
MKQQIKFYFLVIFIVLGFSLNKLIAQDCKVKVDELVGTYKGKCKNGYAHGKGKAVGIDTYEGKFYEGLPHGKGTYTWANGDTYKGYWKYGKRDGIGTFVMKIHEKDSIMYGIWVNDEYKGPKPKRPQIMYRENIDNVHFKKKYEDKNKVLITFKQHGRINYKVSNLTINSSSGIKSHLLREGTYGYENITFPVKFKITYSTPNKPETSTLSCTLEFEIYEPGDWEVDILN